MLKKLLLSFGWKGSRCKACGFNYAAHIKPDTQWHPDSHPCDQFVSDSRGFSLWPFSTIRALKAENNRLIKLLSKRLVGEITLEELSSDSDEVKVGLSGSPLHLLTDALGKQFFESGAPNFIVMSFEHRPSGETFEVTMQKMSGETVCEQLARLRGELDEIKGTHK